MTCKTHAVSLVCLMNASCIPDVQDLGKGDIQDSCHESCMSHECILLTRQRLGIQIPAKSLDKQCIYEYAFWSDISYFINKIAVKSYAFYKNADKMQHNSFPHCTIIEKENCV